MDGRDRQLRAVRIVRRLKPSQQHSPSKVLGTLANGHLRPPPRRHSQPACLSEPLCSHAAITAVFDAHKGCSTALCAETPPSEPVARSEVALASAGGRRRSGPSIPRARPQILRTLPRCRPGGLSGIHRSSLGCRRGPQRRTCSGPDSPQSLR